MDADFIAKKRSRGQPTQDSSPVEWAMGWAAGLAEGLVASRMRDGMGGQSDHQTDDSSNHLRSSTRRRNSL